MTIIYTLLGVPYMAVIDPVRGVVLQKAARKRVPSPGQMSLFAGNEPKQGDTKVEGGVTYQLNQHSRWERVDKAKGKKAKAKAVVPVVEDEPKSKAKVKTESSDIANMRQRGDTGSRRDEVTPMQTKKPSIHLERLNKLVHKANNAKELPTGISRSDMKGAFAQISSRISNGDQKTIQHIRNLEKLDLSPDQTLWQLYLHGTNQPIDTPYPNQNIEGSSDDWQSRLSQITELGNEAEAEIESVENDDEFDRLSPHDPDFKKTYGPVKASEITYYGQDPKTGLHRILIAGEEYTFEEIPGSSKNFRHVDSGNKIVARNYKTFRNKLGIAGGSAAANALVRATTFQGQKVSFSQPTPVAAESTDEPKPKFEVVSDRDSQPPGTIFYDDPGATPEQRAWMEYGGQNYIPATIASRAEIDSIFPNVAQTAAEARRIGYQGADDYEVLARYMAAGSMRKEPYMVENHNLYPVHFEDEATPVTAEVVADEPKPKGRLGDRMRAIAQELRQETEAQKQYTARMLGAAAQLAQNQDSLIDEVVDMVNEDLDTPEALPEPTIGDMLAEQKAEEESGGMDEEELIVTEEDFSNSMTKEEKLALKMTGLRGVEQKTDDIYYAPSSVMTNDRRKKLGLGWNSRWQGQIIEIKEWADVTGNPYDKGYAIIDRRDRLRDIYKNKPETLKGWLKEYSQRFKTKTEFTPDPPPTLTKSLRPLTLAPRVF